MSSPKPTLPQSILNKIPPSKREAFQREVEKNIVLAENRSAAFLLPYDGVTNERLNELMSTPEKYEIKDIQKQFLDNGVAVYILYQEILGKAEDLGVVAGSGSNGKH